MLKFEGTFWSPIPSLLSCGHLHQYKTLYFSSIVSEDGASIYSVSEEAQKEMPNLDVNLRSAGTECLSVAVVWKFNCFSHIWGFCSSTFLLSNVGTM
jgi:hypothetical protein